MASEDRVSTHPLNRLARKAKEQDAQEKERIKGICEHLVSVEQRVVVLSQLVAHPGWSVLEEYFAGEFERSWGMLKAAETESERGRMIGRMEVAEETKSLLARITSEAEAVRARKTRLEDHQKRRRQ